MDRDSILEWSLFGVLTEVITFESYFLGLGSSCFCDVWSVCISCCAFCKSFRCCILDDHIWCHRFDLLYFGMVDVLLGFGRVGCKVEMESMLVELSTVLHISLVWCLLWWPHLLLTQKWGLLGGGLG